jgi:hypothetical protein
MNSIAPVSLQPSRLLRALTYHKIQLAHDLLDEIQYHSGVVSERYMIEMHLVRGGDDDPTSIWHVHYIHVLNDGERVEDQDNFEGTYEQVFRMFIPLR